MNEYEYRFQKEFHEHIVNHVFLPRRLPSFQTTETETHELHILELLNSIVGINELELPFSTIKMIKVLSSQYESNSSTKFHYNLTRLKPGEMLGYNVREQNCAFLVYRPKNNNNDVFISTIQASLEKVYEGEGDIQVDYPTRVVRTPFSKLLKSRVCFQQLCTLKGRRMDRVLESDTSLKDKNVPSTKYVSQWLLAVLSNETSDIVSSDDYPLISKKYRDDVIWNNSEDLPFRRSGLWMAVKAMLQLNLTIEYGSQCGEFVYKLLMIKYMAEIVKFYADEQYSLLDADLVMQMLAKIGRRIDKLAEYLRNCETAPSYPINVDRKSTVVELFYKVKADAVFTIERVREKLQKEFINFQQEDNENRSLSELEDIKFSNHINQQVPKLQDFIAKRLSKGLEVANVAQDVKPNTLKLFRHSLQKDDLPDVQILKSTTGELNTNLLLSDIENWVIQKLDVSRATKESELIRAFAIAYQEKASQFYNDDPIGASRMMLVMLKIIFILDVLAVRKYPLLKEHGSCINPVIIDDLILPQQSHMKVAFELQQYFQTRNRNANFKGLVEHDEINDTSFSARYAKFDLEMNAKRKEILRMIETKISETKAEWSSVRQKAANLRRQFAATACEYRRDDYGKRVHTQGCSHCKLNNTINRLKVEVYERPLRHEEFNQSAVVFELMIPSEIEYLRDVLFIFMHRCCLAEPKANDFLNTKSNAKTVNGTKWTENSQLALFAKSTSQLVFLSSSAKPKKGARSRRYLHPDEPIEKFIADNESNCIFFGSAENRVRLPINFEKQSLKKFCTFKVESNSPYRNLQWTVTGTQHYQNNVLAKQSECHRDLSLAEYISFGSLRADGHRLQLRNIYRAIETDALSFQNNSVMLLILAALWEAGPNKDNTWQRESHEDFSNHDFVNSMSDSILKFMQQQESNWKHPRKLQTAILLTVRLFEMNLDEKIADRLAQLLLYSRRIAMDWIEQIIQARGELIDQNEDKIMLDNLVDVAICGSLTYFVDCNHKFFEKIFGYSGKHNALFAWLTFIVIISNNTILGAYGLNKIDANRKMFLRVVRNTGISIAGKMIRLGLAQPSWLNEFTHSQWSESKAGTFDRWKVYKGFEQEAVAAVTINSRLSYVQIDLITGRFLVNGLPVSRLPDEITNHELFQRLFGDKVFEVQPAHQRFCSLYKFNKCIYSFELIDGDLIITEHRDNGQQCELIPHQTLADEIPFLLVENHSHWWNKLEDTIDFRPKEFKASTPLSNQVEYCLHMKSRLLTEVRTKRCMVDILSSAFKSITHYLSRLESPNYIHILLDEKMEAKVELVRMNLKFFIDKDNNVVSNEFTGMHISQSQALGTLFGLRNGVTLERTEYGCVESTKMLIIPHGEVLTGSDAYDRTGNVLIDVHGPLRSPPFFMYHVDNHCKLIKTDSGYPAWFFLAYMHAMTTHPLPDPFTEMTGCERALQILQSGFSWSPEPYDPESIFTLKKIGEMTPVRKFYQKSSKGLQETIWPDCVPYYSPHDAFLIITTKLIEDSERLKALYEKNKGESKEKSKDESKEDKSESNLSLNQRAYFRYLPYTPNAAITNLFIDHEKGNEVSHWIYNERDENVENIRVLSALYSNDHFSVPENSQNMIFDFLIVERELFGFAYDKIPKTHEIIEFCQVNSIRNVFILLYEIARKKLLSREELILILSLFAREGADLRYLLFIQTVAENQTEFRDRSWDASQFTYHGQPQKYKFDPAEVMQSIQKQQIGLTQFLSQREHLPNFEQMKDSFVDVYHNEVERASIELTNKIGNLWPFDDVITIEMIQSPSELILFDARPIGRMLKAWNQNRKLVEFIDRLEKKVQSLAEMGVEIPTIETWTNPLRQKKQFRKFMPNIDEKMCRQFDAFADDIERAEAVFNQPTSSIQLTECVDEWWRRFIRISLPLSESYLQKTGLFARLVPTTLFPKILQPMNEQQRSLIGSLAVLTTFEQRKSRIARFERQQDMEVAALRHEKENPPHLNWTPNEYPEWLLFEIEMNLSIRKIQVEVAKRMIDPPGGVHSVMQLNMGEGKTAVIVPILAATLANSDQLCQITVLKSLYQTNIKSIRKCLGGMLNRRVYTFPCRRDMPLDNHLSKIQSLYEECKELKGVVITLPEYRLSFQLKMYESALKCTSVTKPNDFIATHEWLNANARNILDESDAILHAKYQLVYTVGEQLPPDGGALRWTIVQALLHTIPNQMYKLWIKSNAAGTVEFNENYIINGKSYGHGSAENRPDVFRPCRIIDNSQDTYDELKKSLAEDFIDGRLHISIPEMNTIVKNNVLNLLLNTDASALQYEECLRYFNESARNTILIMTGLLKYEVLKLALTKRWRVNYGVNLNGFRKMAVPFKAKDVAAERTEFGHPDVAICVTQLSYYYSGLSDIQLQETFKALLLNQNCNEIYDEWLRCVPTDDVKDSVRNLNGVNLVDSKQREYLFPILRYNMYVIDFWLASCVFPREAKTFAGKMMCTAWDLSPETLKKVSTGFSGTNDTKTLLPLPVFQNDLVELEETNENVRRILLRKENESYKRLESNISGCKIIEELVKSKIPVLLDSGALMLELSNEQVAKTWLNLVSLSEFDAAIYFNEQDILQTIDRNHLVTEFDYSVYREKLDRCLVYLDDSHTRGTDLKFPRGTKACVTLSGGITRDKTVQACMRMRLLGQGHTIAFWASHEAHIGICKVSRKSDIRTEDVIEYISYNSRKFEKEGLVHWAAASVNYAQKIVAESMFHKSVTNTESLQLLSKRCSDDEFTPLTMMYGAKETLFVTEITRRRFNQLGQIYGTDPYASEFIQSVRDAVVTKLQVEIPEMKRYAQLLDEEQEKELEHELEEQRENNRPPPAVPMKPRVVSNSWRNLIRSGVDDNAFQLLKQNGELIPLSYALSNTQLWEKARIESDSWGSNIFVSKDFVSVVHGEKHDSFLRPVWWICKLCAVLIIISSFECNSLLSQFRNSRNATLLMYSPRLAQSQSSLLNKKGLRITAKPNGTMENVSPFNEAELALFAGSMYFQTNQEQLTYSNFMGIIPRPRTKEQNEYFNKGLISSSGFVEKKNRSYFPNLSEMCKFNQNPDALAVGIIERRHGYIRKRSDVGLLVNEAKRRRIDVDINDD